MKNKVLHLSYIMIIITCIYAMFSESYLNRSVFYTDKVAVITYHHISPKESAYTITPLRFRKHLAALKKNHYNVISIEAFIDFLKGKKRIPPNAVVITFDDGYESFYQYAYPELMKQHMTATNFLIVGYINKYNFVPPSLKWKQIIEMKKHGFSFYSHTFNSHSFFINESGKEVSSLTNHLFIKSENRLETDEEYRRRIENDLTMADRVLKEKLGNRLSILCFPHGIYNKEVMDIADQIGIQYVFTGKEGFNSQNAREIRRINVGSPTITTDILLKKLKIPKL